MTNVAQIIPLRACRASCDDCVHAADCLVRDTDSPGTGGRYDLHVTPRLYRRGEHAFRCGDPFDAVYRVRSGAVKTYVICPNGEEQVIGFHVAGDLIGLDAIGAGEHLCHAEVLDTSSLCTIPFEPLSRLCAHAKGVHRRLVDRLSRAIQRDQELLLMLGQKSADQRIAAFLLDTAQAQARQGFSATEFNLPMTRADIASYLALAVETVSRVLTRLQGSGVLEVQRNRIRILDREELTALAEADEEEGPAPRASGATH